MRGIIILSLLAAVLLCGCYTHRIYSGDNEMVGSIKNAKGEVVYEDEWQDYFICGLVNNTEPLNIDKLCPDGKVRIQRRTSFVNGLVGALTLCIYTPTEIVVKCEK